MRSPRPHSTGKNEYSEEDDRRGSCLEWSYVLEDHKSFSTRKKTGLFALFLFFASGAIVAVSAFLMTGCDTEEWI